MIDRDVALHARRRPGRLALVDGAETLTYAELERACARVAASFAAGPASSAVGPVVARPETSITGVVEYLGALRSGRDVLIVDRDAPTAVVERYVSRARASTAGTGGRILFLSSGTGGEPKLVAHDRETLSAAVDVFTAALAVNGDDRVLGILPLSHRFGTNAAFGAAFRAGATLVLDRFHPRGTATRIREQGITVLPAASVQLRLLVETPFRERPDLSSLRWVVSGGSALSPAVATACAERIGVAPYMSYGSTEAGPVALGHPEDMQISGAWPARPYPGVDIQVRSDDQAPVAPGEAGMIRVRSEAAFRGYAGDPDATASALRDDRVVMGDIGLLDEEGRLVVLGRAKPMIDVGGRKVAPLEVERCLADHPAVLEAWVYGEPTGRGYERVRARVRLTPERRPRAGGSGGFDLAELRRWCAERLAAHQVPGRIERVESERVESERVESERVESEGVGPLAKPRRA